MERVKKEYILNIILFLLEVFAVGWMMSGFHTGVLVSSRLGTLKYFTIDSNILMGVIALIAAIDYKKVLNGKKEKVSNLTYVLKLVGTVGVTLTMLVTIFFLTPTMAPKYGLVSLYYYSNFFLHLVNPILSIVIFLKFEKSNEISFKQTFIGIVPMLIYAVYYVYETLTHVTNGVIDKGYDWYGLFVLGFKSGFIVVPIIVVITYLISFVLWKLNKTKV